LVSIVLLTATAAAGARYVPVEAVGTVGTVDHVLATLSTAQFEAVRTFFLEHFSYSWKPNDGPGSVDLKGFIEPGDGKTSVEVWNGGIFSQYGYEIGVTSADQHAREAAQGYFKSNGLEVVKGGLFTVGEAGALGHPIGGAFYVSYGSHFPLTKNEKMPLAELKEVITAISPERMSVQREYAFFNFEIKRTSDGFTATDKNGFRVRVVQIPEKDIPSIISLGQVALHFHLREAHVGRKEVRIDDSSKAIYDGRDLFLVLKRAVFDSLKPE
jgi:hypothetical protein